MKISGTLMKHTIEQILANHDLLERFHASGSFSVKILNSPFLPLTIERYGDRVSVSHYYEQNGDLVPDIDMEFHILKNGQWLPHTLTNVFAVHQIASELSQDGIRVRPKALKEQTKFANQWAKNLLNQGFKAGTVLRTDER